MLVRDKYYSKSAKILWKRPLIWTIYCTLIVVLFKEFGFELSIPLAIPSILGTAISLFLGFRTNSAYQRWWEARKIWGEIINNSRTLARQTLHFTVGKSDQLAARQQIVKRQIAWNWALAYRLRNLGWSTETESYINKSEIESLKEADHIPNQILTLQQQSLTSMVKSELIDDFYLRKIDSTLKELCDSMGKCERIKSTVFPTQYALFTLVFIVIFLILLPLGLVSHLGYLSIPVHLAIGFTFGMIQGIAESMQNPFDNKPNDIPMFSICRTVERNLLEMMGKSELPEPIQATDGVLM